MNKRSKDSLSSFLITLKSIFYLSLILTIHSCKDEPIVPVEPVSSESIIILYTNDEHGWMEPEGNYGGAAGLMGIWRENEGYSEEKNNYLILSGGDMWTGPAIATWFQGESMVEVMNEMNYTAAAIGNHEFDFKIEGLKKRIGDSNFPFLSANIREKSTGKNPEFISPYMIKEVNGIKIGIIGLTTTSAPIQLSRILLKNLNS